MPSTWPLFEKDFFGKVVNRFRRQFAGVFERHFNAFHRLHFEAVIFEKFGEAL